MLREVTPIMELNRLLMSNVDRDYCGARGGHPAPIAAVRQSAVSRFKGLRPSESLPPSASWILKDVQVRPLFAPPLHHRSDRGSFPRWSAAYGEDLATGPSGMLKLVFWIKIFLPV